MGKRGEGKEKYQGKKEGEVIRERERGEVRRKEGWRMSVERMEMVDEKKRRVKEKGNGLKGG